MDTRKSDFPHPDQIDAALEAFWGGSAKEMDLLAAGESRSERVRPCKLLLEAVTSLKAQQICIDDRRCDFPA